MALVTEDGTGKADAESYCSVSDADAWHAGRGITLWATMQLAEKEQALRRSTAYMLQRYRMRWKGVRTSSTQALDWPRYDVVREELIEGDAVQVYGSASAYYASNAVPAEVRNACAELAFKGAFGDLLPDVGRLAKREKVDVIEVEYAENAPATTTYVSVENMLAPLFRRAGFGNSIKLVRG